MTGTIDEFKKLVDAEEFFQFFNMSYDLEVVNVHRLHILKKFSQYMHEIDENSPDLSQEEKLNQYSLALQKAYQSLSNQQLTNKSCSKCLTISRKM